MAEDRKFKYEDGRYVNRMTGVPIPDDEPIIIFRARDKYALPVLRHYRLLCTDAHHRRAVQDCIDDFTAFMSEHEDRMKEPGITHHIVLKSEERRNPRDGDQPGDSPQSRRVRMSEAQGRPEDKPTPPGQDDDQGRPETPPGQEGEQPGNRPDTPPGQEKQEEAPEQQ